MPTKQTFRPQSAIPEREDSSWVAAGESLREQIHYVCDSACANERQRELSFLRRLMLYDDTGESQELDEKIATAERSERCMRRAIWVMGLLVGIALAGLGYSFVLVEDIFQNSFQIVVRLSCALGLASAVSLAVFVGIWVFSRAALDEQLEGCRRLVTRIVELRLGKPTETSPATTAGNCSIAHTVTNDLQATKDIQHDIKT